MIADGDEEALCSGEPSNRHFKKRSAYNSSTTRRLASSEPSIYRYVVPSAE